MDQQDRQIVKVEAEVIDTHSSSTEMTRSCLRLASWSRKVGYRITLAAGSGASTAGIGLAAEAGANVVREFAPRRNRHPPKKK